MTINKMKTATFEKVDYEQWKETATKSLKGKPFEQLITKTIEGIDLHPLYTEADLLTRADGALEQTIASIRESKQGTGWIVAQQQYATDGKAFVLELKTSIERGNEAIVYDGSKPLEWDAHALSEIAELMTTYPIFISNTGENDPFLDVFDLIPTAERPKIRGTVFAPGWNKPEGYSNLRTNGADTWTVHHKGADAVTELALTIARAAELAAEHEEFGTFAESFFVRFAVDTHFFLEMAKIRAFRVLWHAFSSAFDEIENAYVPILVETSLRSYSKLDPYVNLLRAGNETFSAVLGGADVVTVHPHNVLTGPTTASIRLARNVQLVIKEETHVERVVDPAGGSYFIESLTLELAEKAWKLFLDIESAGGYHAYVSSGELENLLTQRRSTRENEVAKGSKSLIGTNAYADLDEIAGTDPFGYRVEGRLAEAFENSRSHFATSQPKTVLLTFGALKDFKPRADFVTGFLATGGIRSEWSPTFTNAADAVEWLADETPDYAIVCASPEVTEEVMEELLKGLPSDMTLDLAGKYDETLSKQWVDAGLSGFIFNGQDKIQKFKDIKSKVKNKWKGVEKK